VEAINHVASSLGVVVPLLSADKVDAAVHNIRAAFIAGLSHGMNKLTLILQDRDGPVPLDVRDFVKTFAYPEDIDKHIHDFSLDVYEKIQEVDELRLVVPERKFLAQLMMGDPIAENEFSTLGHYYLPTNEFARAMRGEINLVVGRKGTGKTALFSQVRNKKRQNSGNVVVDLKPEGYQLVKLKEDVLDYLTAGAKAHLITAFWEYLLFLEICHKVLQKDAKNHLRNPDLYDDYVALQQVYKFSENVAEADFSERLLVLSQNLSQEFAAGHDKETQVRLTADRVTALIHSQEIRTLQAVLSRYLRHRDDVWILFDNLDKGWSTQGLARGDIIILRCLIDAAKKVERQMRRDDSEFHVIVFIRNDIYQLLMEESPDFGKESRASLDWYDEDLLREMLRRRLVQNDIPRDTPFSQIWARVCVSHYKGEETSQYLIDRCLMRPRNLLKLFSSCLGFAVNLQHDRIEADDIEKGVRAYSNDLIIDADLELTDVEPLAKKLIYSFLGEDSEFSEEDLLVLFDINKIPSEKSQKVIEFLLYYGFLGIRYLEQEPQYIYQVGYDMQILKTRISKNKGAISYMLNPAFWPGLNIAPNARLSFGA
jgi:molybdopterin-guanine dinucleotide biosynthesis protein